MSCAECRELSTHTFRSPDDLIHALRLAAEEMNRGVLSRVGETAQPGTAEGDALESGLAIGALPQLVQYRFRWTCPRASAVGPGRVKANR